MLLQVAKATGEYPPALRNRPLIGEAEHFYVSSFYELNAFRTVGVTHQPLSVADIKAYIDILGDFSTPERLRFLSVIKTLDQTYINHKIEKGKSNA